MKLFEVYPLFDIQPVKAKGCYVWDEKDEKYLDLYGGHAVISIGHAHPHYVEKITEQVQKIGFYSNSIKNPLQEELAEKLGKLSGYESHRLFLCNSGAEANENALKLASFYNQRSKVITFKKGFHGRTSAAVSLTDNPKIVAPVNANHNVVQLALNDFEAVETELKKGDISAVIIEPIQGVGGLDMPTPAFLQHLRKLCTEFDTVLILDEIQSGYGRSGKFFAHQFAGIEADLISVAKGMGNGFPIGGVLIAPKFEAWYGMLGTTFGGNHLACAAAIAVLDVIEQENLLEHVQHMEKVQNEIFSNLSGIRQVKGKGLMTGVELDFPIKTFRQKLVYEGKVFTGACANPNLLRLLPPLVLTKEDLEVFATQYEQIFQALISEQNETISLN